MACEAFVELKERVRAAARAPGVTTLGLSGVAVVRADAPFVRKSWTPSLSVGVIVQGQKRVRVAGRDHIYRAGCYLVITGEAETEAEILQASARRPYLSLSIQVDPAIVARLLIALTDTNGSGSAGSPAIAAAVESAYVQELEPVFTDTLVRLLRALDDPAERRIVAPLVLEELMFRLLRSDSAAVLRRVACRGDDQRRIQTALAFIRDSAAEPLTVDRIARHVAMSPSHFAHRFRDIVRVSPMRYVKHVRLHRARVLMLQNGARPAEAASAVGYASASHFNRDFKRQFAEPPALYIQRLRAEARVG